MDREVKVKTHLIITDIHEEYHINWCGKIAQMNPMFIDNKLVFVVVGDGRRLELNTNNMKEVEKWGKKLTCPHGRKAITSDKAFIYIKEVDEKEKLVCVVTHNRVKTFAPMYDKVGYR
jgi:hypothetical protein